MNQTCRNFLSIFFLCFTNLINYMDRYSIASILPAIEKDLSIEHWQGGLLQTGFVIFFCLSAPVYGYLGDRYSRKKLILFGSSLWCVCSFVATLMPSYVPFLLFRAMVGLGEAAITTLGPPLISDLFADGQRSVCLAIFYMSIPLGAGSGFAVSATLASATGWRWGLRFSPLLLFLTLICLAIFLENPKRGQAEHYKGEERAGFSFHAYIDDIKYLLRNKSFIFTTIGFTLYNFFIGSFAWWTPTYLANSLSVRDEYHLENPFGVKWTSILFGLVLTFSGIIGLPLGTTLSVKLREKHPRIDPFICGGSILMTVPFFAAAIFLALDNIVATFVLVFLGEIFLNMNWAITADIVMYCVVPTRRSTAEAFQMMFGHALGEAGSPYVFGLIAGAIDNNLNSSTSRNPSNIGNVTNSMMSPIERDFYSFQYTFLVPLAIEVLAGISFLIVTKYVVKDKCKAEEYQELTQVDCILDQGSED